MVTVVNTTTKKLASLEVNDDGELLVTGSAGGGGGGDASLDEQEAQTALLTTIDADTSALAADVAGKVDSTGLALPADFEYLAESYGYTGANLTTVVRTKGANTWTQTLAYTGAVLNSVTKWVKA